ncbi:hypothetical protein [Pectobacterium brasiliense]|uniref:hypothetical protein n=1 Tax=Pectobacterium brasiliense TaxID=180957 RepID=UPI001F079606|nr:hypothetical protein [Pectobacterium brasiliense]
MSSVLNDSGSFDMAILPMSYSPATMAREYRKIGETSVNGRAVDIYIHNEQHHAVAIYGEPDDVNGDLRHVVVAKIDLKSRHSNDETETILAVIGYYENLQLVDDSLAQVEGVIVTKRERNANVASAMYKALINDGIVLVSDNVQFPGGKALWARMARKEVGIQVFYSTQNSVRFGRMTENESDMMVAVFPKAISGALHRMNREKGLCWWLNVNEVNP